MQTLKDLYCECLRKKDNLVQLCKRNPLPLGIRKTLHHSNASIYVVCNRNYLHIESYTILQKAVKPQSFDDECIKLIIDCDFPLKIRNDNQPGDNCLEHLIGDKLIDRIRQVKVCRVPESMCDAVCAILRECRQLVKLYLEMPSGLSTTLVICMALRTLPKLRIVESFNYLCVENLNAVDSDHFLKLRCLRLVCLPEQKDATPWIQFLTSLTNVTALYLDSQHHVKEFIENCHNVLALCWLDIHIGQWHHNETITFTCSSMMMQALISLGISCGKFFWHNLTRACPSLMVLRFCGSKLIMSDYDGHTGTPHLKTLELTEVDIERTEGSVKPPFFQAVTASALCDLRLDLGYSSDGKATLFELKRLIRNPKLLVNCNVRLLYSLKTKVEVFFETNRMDRIRMYLWNYLRLADLQICRQ